MATAGNNWSYVPAPAADGLRNAHSLASQRVILELYERHPVLFGVVDRIAEGVAGLSWHLTAPASRSVAQYLRQAATMPGKQRRAAMRQAAKDGATKRIDVHPFLDWIGRPNPEMSGYDLVKLGSVYMDLVGEDFVWLQVADGVTRGWPVPPTWINDIPRPPSYQFSCATLGRGIPHTIEPESMLYRRHHRPLDPYGRGCGMGQALLTELAADESAAQFLKEYLDKRSQEDLILIHPNFGVTQQAQIEENWLSRLRRVWKRSAPLVTNIPLDTRVEKLGRTLRETQIVQVREWFRNATMQAYGIPPEIMGVLDNSNRATITAASYLCEYYLTLPRAEALQRHWQANLLPRWSEDLILEFDSPVPQDVAQLLDAVSKAPWSVQIEELRESLGLADIGDAGKRVAVPAGYVFVAPDDLPASKPVPAPVPAVEPTKQSARPGVAQAVEPQMGAAMVKLLADIGEDFAGQFGRVVDQALVDLIADLSVASVEDALLAGNLDEILDWTRYRNSLAGSLDTSPGLPRVHADLSRRVAEAVANEAVTVVTSVPYEDLYQAAARWAETHSAQLVTAITEETRAALQMVTRIAYEVRASVPEIAKALRPALGLNRPQAQQLDKLARELASKVAAGEVKASAAARELEKRAGEMLKYRSQMVAQTELWENGNATQVEAWKSTPKIVENYVSEWDMSPRNPCKICRALDGQRQPIGGTFVVEVDGKRYEFRHPTAHPWCYCSLVTKRK